MVMLRTIRLRAVWLIVPAYLLLARPAFVPVALGLALALTGAGIRAWAAGSIRKNTVLTTHGPYAFTRNPLYLGSAFIGLGLAVAAGRAWFVPVFLGFFFIVYGRTIANEERRLTRIFGDEYRRYAAAVPRLLPRIPPRSDISGRTSPARPHAAGGESPGPFQLGWYLKNREYQALLGICAMFLLLGVKLAL